MRLLLGLLSVVIVAVAGSAGVGAAPGATTCSGGSPASPTPIPAGHYKGLTVTGVCLFTGDKVKIDGDLVVAPGATLNDHAASSTQADIHGDVIVGDHGILGLGTYDPTAKHDTKVDGDVIATGPTSIYMSFTKVHGDFISAGGVPRFPTDFRNFPFKDNKIDGNLSITGWHGGWLGVIRTSVKGYVNVSGNASVIHPEPEGCGEPGAPACTIVAGPDPDSTEVMTNDIQGNLICQGNTPPAQVNPGDGGQPNSVKGNKLGECSGL